MYLWRSLSLFDRINEINNQMFFIERRRKKRNRLVKLLISFTETSELERHVGMKAEIGATHDHCVARSISNQPVTLIQGEHT